MDDKKRVSSSHGCDLTRRQMNRGLLGIGLSSIGLALPGCTLKAGECDLDGAESLAIVRDAIDEFHRDRVLSVDPRPTAFDVYLSPHPDDVCFSLGMLAARRNTGALLTIFSTSRFVAEAAPLPTDPASELRWVTALRQAEDRQFAGATGLRLIDLGLLDAPLRGRDPFDDSHVTEDASLIERPLLEAIELATVGRPAGFRPWLFCPMGIGGHADHLAVLAAVLGNLQQLDRVHRIAFYEDLPYASKLWLRLTGIARFNCAWRGPELKRCSLYLGPDTERKLALIRIYESQFRRLPSSIAMFSPARILPSVPHEGLWVEA
jgi:LmbE family N-acetylglucosaminyl deacetylase